MTTPAETIRARGGLAATYELHADGHTREHIAAAVRAGSIERVRQGWYSGRDIHPLLREAARVGGPLTCVSALSLHGAWTPHDIDLHVAVPSNACRLRTRHDSRLRLVDAARPAVRAHWRSTIAQRLIQPPIECLIDLIDCQPAELVIAVADSTIRSHLLLRAEWEALVTSAPRSQRRWLARVDGICESGTESLWFTRMAPFRLPIRRQVTVPGVGRVDFLIGDRLIVEVDGATYHTDPEAFERDRRRDALLSARGYRVLRFSFRQVMQRWHEVEAAVLAAVIRGDHH
jgi:very-short-patch-repair endonuclease